MLVSRKWDRYIKSFTLVQGSCRCIGHSQMQDRSVEFQRHLPFLFIAVYKTRLSIIN
jgi:hypothetical protein